MNEGCAQPVKKRRGIARGALLCGFAASRLALVPLCSPSQLALHIKKAVMMLTGAAPSATAGRASFSLRRRLRCKAVSKTFTDHTSGDHTSGTELAVEVFQSPEEARE